ncbi:MAG: metal-binding protein [Candidatus Aeolococcus gillhamiae]|uniref:Metal-binding protein n=1 Tax=Candidatus Aeolococcus gillhamiae TaxID=3127015 RepID=A0A2W5Z2J1_9BACT|nr:MAG: metal-binding protein [Candidatus Dormibacter sp. RRmetagenome_bin12]
MAPFVVTVADLLHRPGAHRREQVSGPLDGRGVIGNSVPRDCEVMVDALLEWVCDGILATGTAVAPWRGECRRCLAPVGGELVVEFRELFEQSPREGESYPLRGDHIDLAPLAREAVLCALPLAPLCADDCAGLCPTCGIDLNNGACTCADTPVDPRWAVLDLLRSDLGPS